MVRGGFLVGPDGRVHTTFTHNPSSLRLSSRGPNLQNLPRASTSKWANWPKECFVAPAGYQFWGRDFSGIEAVLVGYFAHSARYVRLAKLGVHAFFCSHMVGRPVDLAWSDGDVKAYFKQLKAEVGGKYDTAKRCVHGSNYMMTPRKMFYEYPEDFTDFKHAEKLQGLYFDLFPEIREWHRDLCLRVDGTRRRPNSPGTPARPDPWTLGVAHVTNPFGYVHRFYNVLDWTKIESEWVSSYGEDAKRLVSFLPQSTAAAIIKRSAKRLWYDHPVVGETLRLLIHDEVFGEARDDRVEQCLQVSKQVMEAPILELPLDPTWNLGPHLTIGTEGKVGRSWGAMQSVV